MLLQVGQIVYSKAGRDSGNPFVVVAVDGDYAYIVNGDSRPLARAKKKKSKHIQPTNDIEHAFAAKIAAGVYVNDAEIVKLLKVYNR
ncbi:MAG: KOW domain-containing RNA-binding protein [Defluviitaleaceae bacterium]|nr:KOW domain-containing RNA-binding protein [Defluviitaleaceae bacterium]